MWEYASNRMARLFAGYDMRRRVTVSNQRMVSHPSLNRTIQNDDENDDKEGNTLADTRIGALYTFAEDKSVMYSGCRITDSKIKKIIRRENTRIRVGEDRDISSHVSKESDNKTDHDRTLTLFRVKVDSLPPVDI